MVGDDPEPAAHRQGVFRGRDGVRRKQWLTVFGVGMPANTFQGSGEVEDLGTLPDDDGHRDLAAGRGRQRCCLGVVVMLVIIRLAKRVRRRKERQDERGGGHCGSDTVRSFHRSVPRW